MELCLFLPCSKCCCGQTFYGRMIDVINRGIGGQEAPEELARFESDAIGKAPSLLIWQVGANAVYATRITVLSRWPRQSRSDWTGCPACRWMWC